LVNESGYGHYIVSDSVLHSKLDELEKKNEDLQAEIQRLKLETENLRLSKGKSLII